MRVLVSDRIGRWARYTGIVALAALAWAVVVPDGFFWTAFVAVGLVGSAVGTAVLVRSRQVPSLAQVIASVEAEPVAVSAAGGSTSGAGLSPRGELEP